MTNFRKQKTRPGTQVVKTLLFIASLRSLFLLLSYVCSLPCLGL